MAVLSIQSHVAVGYVGNSAAVFALQRLGHEVWPLHTLLFSNHPGHGKFSGELLEPRLIHTLLVGLERRGVLQKCRAVLSGYLGRAAVSAVVREAVALAKSANGRALFVLDPVLGDSDTGVFVADDVVGSIRDELLAEADIVTPNLFELELLMGERAETEARRLRLARAVLGLGPSMVAVTGIDAGNEFIESLLVNADGAWRTVTPKVKLGQRANGAGDFFTACFVGHYLHHGHAVTAMEQAAAAVHAALRHSQRCGLAELDLVGSQSSWVDATTISRAVQLA